MSEASATSALDALRTHAKKLLALAHAGDGVVIEKLRASLPKLASLDNAAFASRVVLADVQHAIARQRGVKSWAELRRRIEAADPVLLQVERFVHAILENNGQRANRILSDTPAVALYSIHTAAAACDASIVESLLTADSDRATSVAPPDSRQPIISAVASPLVSLNSVFMDGSARSVRLLLEHGANANASIPFGQNDDPLSALYFASESNNIDAVRALLTAGANPNDGESIYHSAERNYQQVMQLLVDAGCDITNRSDGYNNTVLYFIAGHKPSSELCASSEFGMKWLMEHGADPNVTSYVSGKYSEWTSSGETPLHRVAEFGKGVDIATALVQHGANVNAQRRDGRTPYALAIRVGNLPVAEFLGQNGAHTSALSNVDRLLGACAVADVTSAKGIVAEHPHIMSQFTANDRQALAFAAEAGKVDSVRLMVSLGWSLSEEADGGGTPLHQAAWYGRPEMTRLLIELGAPIDFRDKTFGSSPIAWAAHGSTHCRPGHDDDYLAVVNLLLDAGSARDASYNKWKESPESISSKVVASLLKQRGFGA